MKKIYDETYDNNNNASRNIWYTEVPMHMEAEFGILASLSGALKKELTAVVVQDLAKATPVDETNWYFYDSQTSQDANDEVLRTSLMIKVQGKRVYTHINYSDHNFAVNFEKIHKELQKLQYILERSI